MTKARAIYTKEFKLTILSQVESGIPIAQVARENGGQKMSEEEQKEDEATEELYSVA